jgi:hypothetical protein
MKLKKSIKKTNSIRLTRQTLDRGHEIKTTHDLGYETKIIS